MGRKKIKMEFIENLGARMRKFKLRKKGLTKKLGELTTLCDVGACMIIHEPSQNQSFMICPDDRPDRLIESYRSKTVQLKSCGVSDYFAEGKKKLQLQLRKDDEKKYPIWNDVLDSMSEAQLRGLGDELRNKSEMIRSRINHEMRVREMQDRHQLELQEMLMNSADYYNLNNLDQYQRFLVSPANIATTATSVPLPQIDDQNYCGGSSSSSSIPLPQMIDSIDYDDHNYCFDQNENQIDEKYYYNVDDDQSDDEKMNNMMLWDGLMGSLELPYTNIAFSAEDQKLMDSWSWDV